MSKLIKKILKPVFIPYLKLKKSLWDWFYGSFIFKIMIRVFKRVAEFGDGSNECLKAGFLPLPVHYYSPVPDIDDLKKRQVWQKKSALKGIDFNPKRQIDLLKSLGQKYGQDCHWPLSPTDNPTNYFVDNQSFSFGCAAALYAMIRHFKPKKIIEIGSGNSSQIINQALGANKNENHPCQYTIIDPYPTAYVRNRKIPAKLIAKKVETVDPKIFEKLGRNDILFIDSSHSVKIGSDVNFLYLDVLPRLKPGVVVHIHDIAIPYEYPKEYATSEHFRQFWAEQYLLQAFLVGNRDFEILQAMGYLMRDQKRVFQRAFPHYDPKIHLLNSGSFWMRKNAPEK